MAKDIYPALTSVPADHLVAPESQPEYVEAAAISTVPLRANVGTYLSDRQVEIGRGHEIAVIDAESGDSCTFSELSDRSNIIASMLIGLGIKAGDRIAYRSPNVGAAITLMIGIWKAGAIVVPVPLQATTEDLRFYILDTGARLLFSHDQAGSLGLTVDACSGTTIEKLIGFDAWNTRSSHSTSVPYIGDLLTENASHFEQGVLEPNSIAIIWHTGGTTGMPKACYHTHRRFLLAGFSLAANTHVEHGERWAAAAPIGHALGIIYNTIFTLLHGACVVLIERFSDPVTILRASESRKIDTLTALAPTWAKMLQALDADSQLQPPQFKRAYAMWQSASSAEIYDGWRKRGVELLNNFGSTSFATWILTPVHGSRVPPAALGKPLPGYQVAAVEKVDQVIRVLPAGEIGQLAARGPSGLTYWNRPDYQRRDVVDGWTLQDDLIRFDETGNAHYLGRTDYMISTGGYKIAPAEVENVLSAHTAVQEVAVVPGPCPINLQMVVAYVVLRPGTESAPDLIDELRQFVRQRLSPYKAPKRIHFVSGLPRDTVGKVQSKIVREWAYKSANDSPPDSRSVSAE
jgi:2-aminobenzoate-CoA ligase